ncbi:UNVERIFIED_CONTAM: hypothetical protein Cloal_0509 [Acetivibrio alkalicellulosi]
MKCLSEKNLSFFNVINHIAAEAAIKEVRSAAINRGTISSKKFDKKANFFRRIVYIPFKTSL